jgi:hypothetical protein
MNGIPPAVSAAASELGPWALFALMLGVYLVDRFWGKAGKRLDSALATLQDALSTLRTAIERDGLRTEAIHAALLGQDHEGITALTRLVEVHRAVLTPGPLRQSLLQAKLDELIARVMQALDRQATAVTAHMDVQMELDRRHAESMERLLMALDNLRRPRERESA